MLVLGGAGLALVLAGPVCGDPQPTPAELTSTSIALSQHTAISGSPTDVGGTPAPDATPSATEEPTNVAKTVESTSPRSTSDPMVIGGDLWVDARPVIGEVMAFIGGQECGRGQSIRLAAEPPSPIPFFTLEIASDAAQPGCGIPGAEVSITIDGRSVNDTVLWRPGPQPPVSLIAGPSFATYYGELLIDGIPPAFKVLPYIDGKLCGDDLSAMAVFGGKLTYHVVVDPDELRPGCGRDGADVTLRLQIDGRSDITLSTTQWTTGAAVRLPSVNLSGQIPTTPLPKDAATQ